MNRLLTAFATFTLITLVSLLGWLLFDFVKREPNMLGYLRALAAVFGPVPVLVFAAYLAADLMSEFSGGPPDRRHQMLSVLLFGGMAALVPLLAPVLPDVEALRRSGAAPIFLNSWLFSLAVLNFTVIRNLLVAAALCGLSLGITIHIIYS